MQLLLRCEQLRLAMGEVGALYRQLFTWLVKLVRTLEFEQQAQAPFSEEAQSPAQEQLAAKVHMDDVAKMLFGQFVTDAIGPELEVRNGYHRLGS